MYICISKGFTGRAGRQPGRFFHRSDRSLALTGMAILLCVRGGFPEIGRCFENLAPTGVALEDDGLGRERGRPHQGGSRLRRRPLSRASAARAGALPGGPGVRTGPGKGEGPPSCGAAPMRSRNAVARLACFRCICDPRLLFFVRVRITSWLTLLVLES